jgi:hypothetical protein
VVSLIDKHIFITVNRSTSRQRRYAKPNFSPSSSIQGPC